MTRDQRSDSERTYALSSTGDIDCGSCPWSARRLANGGSASIFTISLLTRVMMAGGAPRGANRAYHVMH